MGFQKKRVRGATDISLIPSLSRQELDALDKSLKRAADKWMDA